MTESERPLISVVIAAYDAAETLGGCIDSVLAQTYPEVELVIVDDGSTDDTARILESHPERASFVAIKTENGGPSRARNLGVARATGDWLAFFDADTRLDPRCLEELLAGFDAEAADSQRTASVGGAQRSPAEETPFGRAVQRYFESVGFMTGYVQDSGGVRVVETPHNPSCNLLYRRSVFEQIGGFDEDLWPGEDVDLDHRATLAGYRHRFQPRAVVEHFRPSSARGFGRMMESYGRAQRLLVRRYGFIRKLHYVPLALPAAALLLFVGGWRWPWPTAVAAALVAAAAVIVLERLRRRSGSGLLFYRLFLLNVYCWLAGYVRELLRPKFNPQPSLPARFRAEPANGASSARSPGRGR